ncbi:MAG: MBL fold metallo-hydrolase [Thermaerobacter sp.]|nr:MBL fold metallo-hydrolase [Thermaerobacter sp.]
MFREIAPGLYLQPSLLYQTQCVVTKDASGVTCIDPGYFEVEILRARSLFDSLGAQQGEARRLVLTHSDFDHIVGAPAFTDSQVVTHAAWDVLNEERARDALRRFDGEQYIERTLRINGPLRRDREILSDGEELGEFVCYHADGHTADGLVLFHRPTRALIVGDYLSECEFPFIYVGALRYRATLEKFSRLIAEHRPAFLISQHGRPAADLDEIATRLDESRIYLDALLAAAGESSTAEEVALRSAASWRGAVPDFLRARHLENARIALRDVQG